MSPLDRLRWAAAVASARLPDTCYRLAGHLALAAADGTGQVWESKATMARALKVDVARIKIALPALARAGLLVRGDLRGSCGRQTYAWSLSIPGAVSAPGAISAPGAVLAPPGGADNDENRGRYSPPNGGREGGNKGGMGKHTFRPPVVEEVEAYCAERGNTVDPQRFLDHYEARGWMAGKTKVKDWRACVRTWERSSRPSAAPQASVELSAPDADALAYAAEVECELNGSPK